MSSTIPTMADIASNARWLVQAIDPDAGKARLLEMTADDYRAASFLDDRVLSGAHRAVLVDWSLVEASAASVSSNDARWIFHIGHVGSTLIARLLGEVDGVLSVREPRSLRDIVAGRPADPQHVAAIVARLMSRRFAAHERACVKATSLVSEIAPWLVPPGERALMIHATPRNYIGGILAGENSVQECRALHSSRTERMAARVWLNGTDRSDAHRAAAAWACEMTSLEAAADAMADRTVIWIDFDGFLERPAHALAEIAGSLGFDADERRIEEIVSGPLLRRYSKALEYDYSPALRRDLIMDATQRHASDVASALAMLEEAAGRSPLLARALHRGRGS